MLALTFATRAGRVEIATDADHLPDLMRLRSRFATSSSLTSQAVDVDMDDFLLNLYELASWPSNDDDIHWEPALLRLVEDNAADASAVRGDLAAASPAGESSEFNQPKNWNAELTTFQRRDLSKLITLSHGANFSVPGAGKTRVALALFEHLKAAGRVARLLVVCPKSAFESWITEVELIYSETPPQITTYEGGVLAPRDIVLVNYERLPDARSELLRFLRAAPTMLVLDEAHRMKLGPAGAWGAVCLSLGPFAVRRLILTGTPAPNGARDLENLFAFVWPGQGRVVVQQAVQGSDLRRASADLRPLYVRTTKDELHLPPVEIVVRRLKLPPLHRELYDALLGLESSKWADPSGDVEALGRILLYLLMAATTPALLATGASRHEPLPYRVPPLSPPVGSTLAELMRDLPNYELAPKYQEALAIVAQNASLGRKTIVWSTFVRNLTSLGNLLSEFSPAVVHGGTEDRAAQLTRFRGDKDCMVLLSNPATLGEGISLHHVCHDAVYVDRDFAAGRFLQSLDRIHRLGLPSDTRTQVTLLQSSQTIDEIVEHRLQTKLDFMGHILDDPALLQLSDLDEEPSATIGMDSDDVKALLTYLKVGAPS